MLSAAHSSPPQPAATPSIFTLGYEFTNNLSHQPRMGKISLSRRRGNASPVAAQPNFSPVSEAMNLFFFKLRVRAARAARRRSRENYSVYLFSFRMKKANVDLTMKEFQGIFRNKREEKKKKNRKEKKNPSDFQCLPPPMPSAP